MRLTRALGRVTVSPQMVYGSFTLLGVGLYLLGVGLVGEAAAAVGAVAQRERGGARHLPAHGHPRRRRSSSRAVRARFRQFVSRHLLRSRYDYRKKWLEVTDAFRSTESGEEILDRLIDLLARTFGAGRLSVWTRFEADERFHQVRSTNIEPPPRPARPRAPDRGGHRGGGRAGGSHGTPLRGRGRDARRDVRRPGGSPPWVGRPRRVPAPQRGAERGGLRRGRPRPPPRDRPPRGGAARARADGGGPAGRGRARRPQPLHGLLPPRLQEPGGAAVARGPERGKTRRRPGVPRAGDADGRADGGTDGGAARTAVAPITRARQGGGGGPRRVRRGHASARWGPTSGRSFSRGRGRSAAWSRCPSSCSRWS